jgi:hypothetical protein
LVLASGPGERSHPSRQRSHVVLALLAMSGKEKRKRTLLEEAETADARLPTKQVRLRKQNTEQQVSKAIKDNCGDMSATEVDGTKVQGLTLRETLLKDKRAVRHGDSKETFGKKYYEKLRDTFSAAESPSKLLMCGEDTLPVNPDLFTAMVSLKKTPVNRCSDHDQKFTYADIVDKLSLSPVFSFCFSFAASVQSNQPSLMSGVCVAMFQSLIYE